MPAHDWFVNRWPVSLVLNGTKKAHHNDDSFSRRNQPHQPCGATKQDDYWQKVKWW